MALMRGSKQINYIYEDTQASLQIQTSDPRDWQLRIAVVDWKKLDIQLTKANYSLVSNGFALSHTARQFERFVQYIRDIEDKHQNSNIIIDIHLKIQPHTPAKRLLAVFIFIYSEVGNRTVEGVLTEIREYCSVYLRRSAIQQNTAQFTSRNPSLKFPFPERYVLKQKATAITNKLYFPFDLIELEQVLGKVTYPTKHRNIERWEHPAPSYQLGTDIYGNQIMIPEAKRLFLIGDYPSILTYLLQTNILPTNMLLFLATVPEKLQNLDGVQVIKYEDLGINLLQIMYKNKAFAFAVMRLLEAIAQHPEDSVRMHKFINFLSKKQDLIWENPDFASFQTMFANPLNFKDSGIDESRFQRLISIYSEYFEDPVMSHFNIAKLKQGGRIIVDLASVPSARKRLGIGIIFVLLQQMRYLNFQIGVSGWHAVTQQKYIYKLLNTLEAADILYLFETGEKQHLYPPADLTLMKQGKVSLDLKRMGVNINPAMLKLGFVAVVPYRNPIILDFNQLPQYFPEKHPNELLLNLQITHEKTAERNEAVEVEQVLETDSTSIYEQLDDYVAQYYIIEQFELGENLRLQEISGKTRQYISYTHIEDYIAKLMQQQIMRENASMYSVSNEIMQQLKQKNDTYKGMTAEYKSFMEEHPNLLDQIDYLERKSIEAIGWIDLLSTLENLYFTMNANKTKGRHHKYIKALKHTILRIESEFTEEVREYLKDIISSAVVNYKRDLEELLMEDSLDQQDIYEDFTDIEILSVDSPSEIDNYEFEEIATETLSQKMSEITTEETVTTENSNNLNDFANNSEVNEAIGSDSETAPEEENRENELVEFQEEDQDLRESNDESNTIQKNTKTASTLSALPQKVSMALIPTPQINGKIPKTPIISNAKAISSIPGKIWNEADIVHESLPITILKSEQINLKNTSDIEPADTTSDQNTNDENTKEDTSDSQTTEDIKIQSNVEGLAELSIDMIDLDTITLNILKANNISTIGKLVRMHTIDKQSIRKFRGMGAKRFAKLEMKIAILSEEKQQEICEKHGKISNMLSENSIQNTNKKLEQQPESTKDQGTSSKVNIQELSEDLEFKIPTSSIDKINDYFAEHVEDNPREIVTTILADYFMPAILGENVTADLQKTVYAISKAGSYRGANISTQSFLSELEQNFKFWEKYSEPVQRVQIVQKMQQKFTNAFTNFRYSELFKDVLRKSLLE